MPISAFWTCYSYIERLRADESLSKLPELQLSQADAASARSIVEGLQHTVGTVVVEKAMFDHQGWDALKSISDN